MVLNIGIRVRQRRLEFRFNEQIPRLLDAIAKSTVQGIVNGIFKQIKPSGRAQKKNKPGTVQKKSEKGVKPNIPLFDEGLFIDESTYQISRVSRTVRRISVKDKKNRKQIQKKLAKQGYDFMGVYPSAKSKNNKLVAVAFILASKVFPPQIILSR